MTVETGMSCGRVGKSELTLTLAASETGEAKLTASDMSRCDGGLI